jgi:hypothetical protein
MVDRHHSDTNRAMHELIIEAGVDLAKAIAPQSGKPAGEESIAPTASPSSLPAAESVDETIEGILKGK